MPDVSVRRKEEMKTPLVEIEKVEKEKQETLIIRRIVDWY